MRTNRDEPGLGLGTASSVGPVGPQPDRGWIFEDRRAFAGDGTEALDHAENVLTGQGFEIVSRTSDDLELRGPGMSSSRQAGVRGASRIRILRRGGELGLLADLSAVRRLVRFVWWFPPALCLFLFVVLGVVFGLLFRLGAWLPTIAVALGINLVLFLVLAPLIGRKLRGRTEMALRTLLENMVVLGESRAEPSSEGPGGFR